MALGLYMCMACTVAVQKDSGGQDIHRARGLDYIIEAFQ